MSRSLVRRRRFRAKKNPISKTAGTILLAGAGVAMGLFLYEGIKKLTSSP